MGIVKTIFKIVILLFCLSLLFWAGTELKKELDARKITHFQYIKIGSNGTRIPIHDVQSLVLSNLHGTFFTIPLTQLKEQILLLPWVGDISIRKVWPNKLVIQLFEQVPWAAWNSDSIINITNQIIKVPENTIPKNLPQLSGASGSEQTVIDTYQWLTDDLNSLNLKILKLSVDSRFSWTLLLNNNVQVILGKENIKDRFVRFVHLYPELMALAKGRQLLYIDLRYPNGFVVKWNNN